MSSCPTVPKKILLRRDTSINWFIANPLLASGEQGYDITLGRMKIGDGIRLWNDLPFFNIGPTGYTGWTGWTGWTGNTGPPGTAANTGATGWTGWAGSRGGTGCGEPGRSRGAADH